MKSMTNQAIIAWSIVVLGPIIVGVGGFIATWGWNKVRAEEQRQNIIVGLAREVSLNHQMIQDALALAARWPTRSEAENFYYQEYRSSLVVGALTSGQFDPEAPDDGELLAALERYERAISGFNAELRIVTRFNPGLFLKAPLIHVTDPKTWPPNSEEGLAEPFLGLLNQHKRVTELLRQRFPWAGAPGFPL